MTKAIQLFEAIDHHREADAFDFRRSWEGIRHACRGRRALIAAVVAVTLAVTLLYVKIWPPVFVATVTLVGESQQDMSRGTFYQSWNVFRDDSLPDEAHMITAAPVLEEVIQKLDLKDNEVYHSFFDYAGILWTTSWVGSHYRHLKDWIFPPEKGPYIPTPEEIERARVLRDLRTGIGFERVTESNLGNLVVRGPTRRVAEIANTIIAVYMEQRRARHVQEADAAYNALAAEAAKAHAEVMTAEARMKDYYAANDMLLTFEKDKLDIGQMQAIKASIDNAQSSIAGNESALAVIDSTLKAESEFVVSSRVVGVNPLHDALRARLADLQITRKTTLMHYQPDAPEVGEIDRQIAILSAQMNREPSSDLQQNTTMRSPGFDTLRAKQADLRATLAGQRAELAAKLATYTKYQSLLSNLPEKMQVVHDLDRDHGEAEKKYGAIQEKMMVAAVSRASAQTDSDSIRIVEAAALPNDVTWPRTKLLLLAATALGLLAGVALAMLMDLFFGRVHRFRIIGMGDVPIYATVERERDYVLTLFGIATLSRGDGRNDVRLLREG